MTGAPGASPAWGKPGAYRQDQGQGPLRRQAPLLLRALADQPQPLQPVQGVGQRMLPMQRCLTEVTGAGGALRLRLAEQAWQSEERVKADIGTHGQMQRRNFNGKAAAARPLKRRLAQKAAQGSGGAATGAQAAGAKRRCSAAWLSQESPSAFQPCHQAGFQRLQLRLEALDFFNWLGDPAAEAWLTAGALCARGPQGLSPPPNRWAWQDSRLPGSRGSLTLGPRSTRPGQHGIHLGHVVETAQAIGARAQFTWVCGPRSKSSRGTMPSSWAVNLSSPNSRCCRSGADSGAPGVETGGIDHQAAADQLVDHGARMSSSASSSAGSRLLFWLQALTSALSERVLIRRADLFLYQAADHARL